MSDHTFSDTPPPGLVSSALGGSSGTITLTPAPVAAPGRTGKVAGFALAPEWVDWVPVTCLTIVLLLTVLPWVGSYPGGVRTYTQTPWGALSADVSVNTLPAEVLQDEKAIKDRLHTSWWLALYLPLLILAVGAFWAERFIPVLDRDKVPRGLEFVPDHWHHRLTVFAGVAAVLFVLVEFQALVGFGLEAAGRRLAQQEAAGQLAVDDLKAKSPQATRFEVDRVREDAEKQPPVLDSRAKQDKYDVYIGRRVGAFAFEGTSAWDMVVVAHLLAIAALGVRYWLDRRGAKPPPRLEVRY